MTARIVSTITRQELSARGIQTLLLYRHHSGDDWFTSRIGVRGRLWARIGGDAA